MTQGTTGERPLGVTKEPKGLTGGGLMVEGGLARVRRGKFRARDPNGGRLSCVKASATHQLQHLFQASAYKK